MFRCKTCWSINQNASDQDVCGIGLFELDLSKLGPVKTFSFRPSSNKKKYLLGLFN